MLGAYDLIGNVWEWTKSWYLPGHGAYESGDGSPDYPSFDPRQPSARSNRNRSRQSASGSTSTDACVTEHF